MKTTNELLKAILSNIDFALKPKKEKIHIEAMDAVKGVISYRTLPPQIDFIPYSTKEKYQQACDLLDTMAKKYWRIAEKEIQSYYEPTENGYSCAEMDAMF